MRGAAQILMFGVLINSAIDNLLDTIFDEPKKQKKQTPNPENTTSNHTSSLLAITPGGKKAYRIGRSCRYTRAL